MSFNFTYDEFSDWYDTYASRYLKPALTASEAALAETLDEHLRERDRVRVQVRPGRVKSKARAWQKLNAKYREKVESLDDIPIAMDDLVGLRIVSTNTSDLTRLLDLFATLPQVGESNDHSRIAIDPESHRDYITKPKPSGYRAYHVNLRTVVSHAVDWHPITCEVQLRTLLQDSWGELTHEDTYKPGSEPPQLIATLSKRLASLTATLDEIAQDLRDEIESAESDAAEPQAATESEVKAGPALRDSEPAMTANRDAVYEYLRDRVAALQRPVDLASLAWDLQREFGQEIARGWLGHEKFGELVKAAVPDAKVETEPPAYVAPMGFSAAAVAASAGSDQGIPAAAHVLRAIDRAFPIASTEEWERIYEVLGKGTSNGLTLGKTMGMADLNALVKSARDGQGTHERRVTRTELEYVAKALYFAGKLSEDMDASFIAEVFATWTAARLERAGVDKPSIEEVKPWLNPYAERGSGS